MSITEEGRAAESWARTFLKARGYELFQADWMARRGPGRYFVVEVKRQERFEPPPFEGHGLAPQQVKARIEFTEATGIRTLLLVREKGTDRIFHQWLDVLEAGDHFDTKGRDPRKHRRVYPLTAFNESHWRSGG